MNYRHLYPMVRLLAPFMCGIMLAIWSPLSIQISWVLLVVSALFLFSVGLIPGFGQRFLKSSLFGLVLFCLLLVFGYKLVMSHNQWLDESHFVHHMDDKSLFIAKIAKIPEEKENSIKTIIEATHLKKGTKIEKVKGRILVYFEKDSLKPIPRIGSQIIFSATPELINKALNPGSFDYRKYMAMQNVFHQIYLPSYAWKLLQENNKFNISQFAFSARQRFIHSLQKSGLENQEFAVAVALMLGQDDMLDAETMSNYSGSGVVHILCVSGLHVAIIYLIISTLLKTFKKNRYQKYINLIIILGSIWAYSILTGLAPSVLRSAAMFTFITFGNLSRRYVHIINSLAASAFCLLLFNPFLISNIGFQLSYLAILGIVFINPHLLALWNTQNKVSEYVWGLITVSISAQIATSPLTIMYFHQFPLYFLPANLAAVPISGFIIYTGILALITSPITAISEIFGFLTSYLIMAMNYCVGFFEDLPYSVIRIISIGTFEYIALYLIIISALLLVFLKQKIWFFTTLVFTLALVSSISINKIQQWQQKKIIVYHANKQSIIGFVNGENQTLVAHSAVLKDKNIRKYTLQGFEDKHGITNFTELERDSLKDLEIIHNEASGLYAISSQMFLFEGKRVLFADSLPKRELPIRPLKVDFVVLSKNSKFKIKHLLNYYNPRLIVIEPSAPMYRSKKWIEECNKEKVPYYNIASQGAFVTDL